MLNHATNRVNESEKERNASADDHKKKYAAYDAAERRLQQIAKTMKRTIRRTKPYFELKASFNQRLDDQKRQVEVIEETIVMTKRGYADSLKQLEKISEEIHDQRLSLGIRGEGVGAEAEVQVEGASKSSSSSSSSSTSPSPNSEKIVEEEIKALRLKEDDSSSRGETDDEDDDDDLDDAQVERLMRPEEEIVSSKEDTK